MAHKRKDTLTKPRQWWKHLRPEWKRRAAKDERRAARKQINDNLSKCEKPPVGGMGGCIHDWERSLDPWHVDAFPDEFKDFALRHGERPTSFRRRPKVRRHWGALKPVTKVKPSAKVFKRREKFDKGRVWSNLEP